MGTVTGKIQQALEGMDVPRDVNILIGGQNREMQTSLDSLAFAFGLAIFLVYIVMASQFESFIHPLVIIFSIPLALIGVVLVLLALGISLSVVVFLGLIMLAGIVVNNAIVMVDYINRLRRGGMAKFDAIERAASIRFRPIVMTTSTTVLGLLPMALGLGEGAELRNADGHHRRGWADQRDGTYACDHSHRLFPGGSGGLTRTARASHNPQPSLRMRNLWRDSSTPSCSASVPSSDR